MATYSRNHKGLEPTHNYENHRFKDSNSDDGRKNVRWLPGLPLWLAIFTFYSLTVFYLHFVNGPSQSPAAKNGSTPLSEFAEARAKDTLDSLTGFGSRPVGSHSNEILAKEFFVQKTQEIKSTANSVHSIEIDVQNVRGTFVLEFLGGMGQVYDNIKNVVVKLGPAGGTNNSLLVNCHYDTFVRSPGASDDGASCCVMLEALRVFSQSPKPFKHNIIFLFNGGEENILQASHGFVTQHRWMKDVRAFVNLDSAGAGGRELVFQTGPDHPWLVKAYMQSATYPFASVLGQEIFQNGLIPADTDFRIFRDYGGIPGLDIATISNGFIYHTKFDTPDMIPAGSLQRAGDNLVPLLSNLGNSPLLPDPGEDRHGKMVFFDVSSLFMVAYPQRMGWIVNGGTLLIIALGLYRKTFGISKSPLSGIAYLKLLGGAIAAIVLTWLVAAIVCIATALGVTLIGRSMSWYTYSYNLAVLYVLPPVLACLSLHNHLKRTVYQGHNPWMMESVFFEASQVIWSLVTLVLTMADICSGYLAMVWVLIPQLVREKLLSLLSIKPKDQPVPFVFLHLLGQVIPTLCYFYPLFSTIELFIPIVGRSGTAVSPDIPICLLMLLGIIPCISLQAGLVYITEGIERVLKGLAVLSGVGILLIIFTPLGFPFRFTPNNPTCQRLIIVHMDRTFHNAEGEVTLSDSGIWWLPFNYYGYKLVENAVPQVKTGRHLHCDAPYCGMPYYLPISEIIDPSSTLYSPGPKLDVEPRLKFLLSRRESLGNQTERLTFQVTGPDHMTCYITPRKGVSMIGWSLADGLPLTTHMPAYCEEDTYFIYYSYGEKPAKPWEFYIDLQVLEGHGMSGAIVEVAFAGHYINGEYSTTDELTDIVKQLPDWTVTVYYTSTYDSFII